MGCSKTFVQRKDVSGEEALGLFNYSLTERWQHGESFFFFLKD
jgi:hypothetical protein